MRKDQKYFNSKAIGSSLLSTYIEDSPDHALIEPKPTNSMERGRIWEDLVEQYMTDGWVKFMKKYYISNVLVFPEPSTRPSIPTLMDSDNVEKAIKDAYVWTQSKNLNQTFEKYHNMLTEIEHQGYKRPIPKTCWDKMDKMWNNLCKAEWCGNNIVNMLMENSSSLKFQQIHYWKDIDCLAECRMKSDIECDIDTTYGKEGWIADLKFTGGIKQFTNRFIHTRWQDAHYSIGYARQCAKREIKPPQNMIYIIADFEPPHLIYVREMLPLDTLHIQSDYKTHLANCWKWIKGGRETVGYLEQSINKYGRVVNQLIEN